MTEKWPMVAFALQAYVLYRNLPLSQATKRNQNATKTQPKRDLFLRFSNVTEKCSLKASGTAHNQRITRDFMNNEQVIEETLENASECVKSLLPKQVGWRKGELTMIMAAMGKGHYSAIRRHIMTGGLFATPGYEINIEANERFDRAIMDIDLRGHTYDRIWVDEVFGLYNGKAKKPDWKCSAMERHVQKGDSHKEKPSKLIKALVNSMEPTYYTGILPKSTKGAW